MIENDAKRLKPWELSLMRLLPILGHRNWIVVADSAYPAQSNPAIETVATEADHAEVLTATLDAIDRSRHVRANIFVDSEFQFVEEQDGPGVTKYRQDFARLVANRETHMIPHDQIIAKLDDCGKLFRVLILKSTLTIPYTSVFFELDCGYWTRAAEEKLRLSVAQISATTR